MKMTTAKKIVQAIANREYDLPQWHRVTVTNLSRQTKLSISTCYRYTKALSKQGYLKEHRFDYNGELDASSYTVSEQGHEWLSSWRTLL